MDGACSRSPSHTPYCLHFGTCALAGSLVPVRTRTSRLAHFGIVHVPTGGTRLWSSGANRSLFGQFLPAPVLLHALCFSIASNHLQLYWLIVRSNFIFL